MPSKKPKFIYVVANVALVSTTNEAAFQAFVQGQCIDQAYNQPHAGNASRILWQRGEKVRCKNCRVQVQLDAKQRPIVTGALQKTCKGSAIRRSPPSAELFRRQTAKSRWPTMLLRPTEISAKG